MKISRQTIYEILRFGIVGVVATVLHYVIYWILQHWINVNVAYTIGYFLSFIANYFLSAQFTFREKTTTRNGIGFAGAHLFNYLFQMVLLNIFLWLGVSKEKRRYKNHIHGNTGVCRGDPETTGGK